MGLMLTLRVMVDEEEWIDSVGFTALVHKGLLLQLLQLLPCVEAVSSNAAATAVSFAAPVT